MVVIRPIDGYMRLSAVTVSAHLSEFGPNYHKGEWSVLKIGVVRWITHSVGLIKFRFVRQYGNVLMRENYRREAG